MEWVTGSKAGWFLGGIFMVAFVAVAYFLVTRIRKQRDGK